MKRTLRHPQTGSTVELEALDDVLLITTDGDMQVIEAFAERQMPADILFQVIEHERRAEGFVVVLPDDLLDQVQGQQGVKLSGRLRAFYETGEWKAHEGKKSNTLGCTVSFVSTYSIGSFGEEFWDAANSEMVDMLCLCSRTNERGYEDEQSWIGADPRLADGPVYALYTSNAYEELFPSLDAFLADLE
jgi:hypothetical protein